MTKPNALAYWVTGAFVLVLLAATHFFPFTKLHLSVRNDESNVGVAIGVGVVLLLLILVLCFVAWKSSLEVDGTVEGGIRNVPPPDWQLHPVTRQQAFARPTRSLKRCSMVCITCNKFGNQLRHIQTCWNYASWYGLDLFVIWGGGDIAEDRILQECLPSIAFTHVPPHSVVDETAMYGEVYGTNFHLWDEAVFQNPNPIATSTAFRSIYSARPLDMERKHHFTSKFDFYHSLFTLPTRIRTQVQKILTQIASRQQRCLHGDFMGVHIRATDNYHDAAKTHLNTPVPTFLEILHHLKGRNENAHFIICTDNPALVRSHLAGTTLTCTFAQDIEPLPCDKEQALAEMWLLSRFSVMVGSKASTFSYESFFMNPDDLDRIFWEYDATRTEWVAFHPPAH